MAPSTSAKQLAPPFFAPIRGKRVLAVDDNATNRKVLLGQLLQCGTQPKVASSAEEALTLLRQAHREGKPFDAALLDHRMPDLDGEALGRIIVADETLKPTRLILLTSSGQRDDGTRYADIGFAGYLLKPVTQRELNECLTLALAAPAEAWHMKSQPIITQQALESVRVKHRAQILLAEDNLVNQKVAVRLLEKLGYRVDVAQDGRAAVNAWSAGSYDLLLMDCQMPELDGYEATREIRRLEHSKPQARRTPIIALTADALKGTEAACEAAGMDGYLSKPIDRVLLESTLAGYLSTAS
jgi:Response regulator containing a CheY-like receiver domain and a GGDEF domain